MPIYEYRCNNCGQFEIVQKITERALKRCPTCQSKVTKLISNTSFQLKGSGWYVTDYGGKASAHSSTDGNGNGKGKATDTKAESSSASGEKKEGTPGKSSEPAAA
jgi:putative FmdB family regulatory protein